MYGTEYIRLKIFVGQFSRRITFSLKKIKEGDTVKIKVSKGTEKVEVPDFEGYTFDEYTELLDELNIPYTEVTEINYEYEDGYVTKVSPGPGKEINITDDEILTVYYAKNPEPTEAPTEPPTEAPTKVPNRRRLQQIPRQTSPRSLFLM